MTNSTLDLDQIASCVKGAQMTAVCDHWHLTERALPSLKAIAQDTAEPRLQAAADGTATASDHLSAAKDILKEAAELIRECAAERSQAVAGTKNDRRAERPR
jgi:hypothetical protein